MTTESFLSKTLSQAAQAIRGATSLTPRTGIVLGSGLGGFVEAVEVDVAIPYAEIPGFGESTVEGHSGRLVIGHVEGATVAVMQGRIHMYEGYDPQEVVFPVRVLASMGIDRLVVTNASGSVNPDFDAPELMLITDHLNFTGKNPLVGPNPDDLGTRFPDMTDAYDPDLLEKARAVAAEQGAPLLEGVYVGLLGPSFETPAEIRMLHRLGADAVGMSTVLEVIAARHMGVRVLGLSCISNKGAGLSKAKLHHDDVKKAAAQIEGRFVRLLKALTVQVAEA